MEKLCQHSSGDWKKPWRTDRRLPLRHCWLAMVNPPLAVQCVALITNIAHTQVLSGTMSTDIVSHGPSCLEARDPHRRGRAHEITIFETNAHRLPWSLPAIHIDRVGPSCPRSRRPENPVVGCKDSDTVRRVVGDGDLLPLG
jgi:hypothetical protein